MARKKSPHLSEAELRLMDVLWEKAPVTVAEVAEALPKGLNLAYLPAGTNHGEDIACRKPVMRKHRTPVD